MRFSAPGTEGAAPAPAVSGPLTLVGGSTTCGTCGHEGGRWAGAALKPWTLAGAADGPAEDEAASPTVGGGTTRGDGGGVRAGCCGPPIALGGVPAALAAAVGGGVDTRGVLTAVATPAFAGTVSVEAILRGGGTTRGTVAGGRCKCAGTALTGISLVCFIRLAGGALTGVLGAGTPAAFSAAFAASYAARCGGVMRM